MALTDSLDQKVQNLNRFPRYLQTVSFSTSGASTQLNATFADGSPVPMSATYLFQPDQDVYLDLLPTSALGTARARSHFHNK